ncbi:ADP-ribosyltransferase [Paenibacillus popilliae]|uniref:NAD+--asparagine ADP-ribosyltransferase n=1 Tax=Paenibacillus popilliae ATCC 14706 TaxID=1212764 RepID=M9LR70_PAEPP|nr:ADP-ribosyltransferase [Paenibacillus popilliae]GAC43701.1 NAD+--asparagine ADP-ribosyltransferase [Paenibacillus popilliae ATCC 14706]
MDVKKNIKKIFLTAMMMLSISLLMPVAQMSSVNAQATEAGQASGDDYYRFYSGNLVKEWNNAVSPSWLNRLSEEEKDSIRDYTEDAELINGYLRNGVSDDVGNGYTRQIIRDAESISKGLQKFNLSEGVVVYRNIHMPEWEEVEPSDLIGAVITDNAFVSTALYKTNLFKGNVDLELNVPAGYCAAPVMSLAKYPFEYEFLLDKGTSYVIRDVRRENGILKASAEVLPLERKENDQFIVSDEVLLNTEFTVVGDATKDLGGQSEKYIVQDKTGERWLFKVSGKPWKFDWVGEAEVGANKLLQALDQPSVEIENVTLYIPGVGKRSGSVQKMIDLKTWGLNYQFGKLTDENRKQLQESQIIDYLIANLDCHDGNFGIDSSGNIVAFDKGQALKHVGDTSRITECTSNPDSILSLIYNNKYNQPCYTFLWDGWLKNEYEMDLMSVKPLIEKIESLSEPAFSDMFRAYAEGREKQLGESAKEFLDVLVERKNTIRSKVEDFYKELASKKGISFEGFFPHADEVPAYKLAS